MRKQPRRRPPGRPRAGHRPRGHWAEAVPSVWALHPASLSRWRRLAGRRGIGCARGATRSGSRRRRAGLRRRTAWGGRDFGNRGWPHGPTPPPSSPWTERTGRPQGVSRALYQSYTSELYALRSNPLDAKAITVWRWPEPVFSRGCQFADASAVYARTSAKEYAMARWSLGVTPPISEPGPADDAKPRLF